MTAKTQSATSDFFDTSRYATPENSEFDSLLFLKEKPTVTAIVYYEGRFEAADSDPGKDLATYSRSYQIVSFIDDVKSGKDAGKVINGKPNEIPVYRDLGTALAQSNGLPKFLIFEKASVASELLAGERRLLLRALGYGIGIATNLHEHLTADPEFTIARGKKGAEIRPL